MSVFYLAAHLFTQSRVSPIIISPYSPFPPYRPRSSEHWNYKRFSWVPPHIPDEQNPPRGEQEEEEEERYGDAGRRSRLRLRIVKPDLHQQHLRCNYFVSQLPLSPIDFASVPPFHTPPLLAHDTVVVPAEVSLTFLLPAIVPIRKPINDLSVHLGVKSFSEVYYYV